MVMRPVERDYIGRVGHQMKMMTQGLRTGFITRLGLDTIFLGELHLQYRATQITALIRRVAVDVIDKVSTHLNRIDPNLLPPSLFIRE